MESKRGSRGRSPLARQRWQTAEGFAQMAGGGGRGNANSKQALASGAGGQRGCVCQTSGLAMGRPSPARHNAGSEPAGHVVAPRGVSRSGVPKWFRSRAQRLRSVIPALKNPSAFHFFPSPHPCYVPLAPYVAPAAVATQQSPHGSWGDPQLPPDKGGRGGSMSSPSCCSPIHLRLPGLCSSLLSLAGLWEAVPSRHSSVCEPGGPCLFLSLTPARLSHKAQGLREHKLSTAGKEEEEEEEGCTKHLGLSQSLVCNMGKLCSKLVRNV